MGKSQKEGRRWFWWLLGLLAWQAPAPNAVLAPYDKLKVDQQSQKEELAQVMSSAHAQSSADSIVRDLQHCVNLARKAEGRVKRLLSEKALKNAQWEQYQRDVRSAFAAEKKRHSQNLEKISQELEQALRNQEDARSKVRLAAQGQPTADVPMPDDGDLDDPWLAQMMMEESEAPPDDAALQAVLTRALQPPSAGQAIAHSASVGSPAFRTPQRQVLLPRTPLPKSKVVPAKATGIGLGAQAQAPGTHHPATALGVETLRCPGRRWQRLCWLALLRSSSTSIRPSWPQASGTGFCSLLATLFHCSPWTACSCTFCLQRCTRCYTGTCTQSVGECHICRSCPAGDALKSGGTAAFTDRCRASCVAEPGDYAPRPGSCAVACSVQRRLYQAAAFSPSQAMCIWLPGGTVLGQFPISCCLRSLHSGCVGQGSVFLLSGLGLSPESLSFASFDRRASAAMLCLHSWPMASLCLLGLFLLADSMS